MAFVMVTKFYLLFHEEDVVLVTRSKGNDYERNKHFVSCLFYGLEPF